MLKVGTLSKNKMKMLLKKKKTLTSNCVRFSVKLFPSS